VTEPFIGSEAIASGRLNRHQLRSRFTRIHPGVYGSTGTDLTAVQRAHAAWLWSRRRGVVAGQSAAALHKAKWVDHNQPAQLLYDHRRPPPGILTWSDHLAPDEIQLIGGTPATTPTRTAFDLATHFPLGRAVAAIDALARATRLNISEVELLAERYKGHRNIRRARQVLSLVDAGAESPQESWLRLLVIKAGYPPPQTQIPIYGRYGELVAVVDMGWEEIKLALDYEGDHHRTNRSVFNHDIVRHEALTTELGWIDIRVTSQNVQADILRRLAQAWSRRTCSEGEKIA
jgi:hypothetical protein